ncbi:MAG: 7-cyano-7-deazaguanine synthase [Solirubrobacterales bacterium]|nr:7-cyano-7-deazaguanine synthase [Solirubrobacterales bacterium]
MATGHLILLSGGIDSACLLAERAARRLEPTALFVDYGQSPADRERSCSKSLAAHFGVKWSAVRVGGLTIPNGEIPGRNALLAHLAVVHIGSDASCIYLGIHAGTPYRDCTQAFVEETQRSIDFQSGGACQLVAPYLTWNKAEVHQRAKELGVPLGITHSCERAEDPCGNCASCIDREALLASA